MIIKRGQQKVLKPSICNYMVNLTFLQVIKKTIFIIHEVAYKTIVIKNNKTIITVNLENIKTQ